MQEGNKCYCYFVRFMFLITKYFRVIPMTKRNDRHIGHEKNTHVYFQDVTFSLRETQIEDVK